MDIWANLTFAAFINARMVLKKKPGSIVLYEGQNSFALTQGQFCEKDPPCIKKKPFLANKFNCASLF